MKTVRLEFVSVLSLRHADCTLLLPDEASVRDVLQRHGLTHGEVGLILVNGELADENEIVPNDAWIKLYPFHYQDDMR